MSGLPRAVEIGLAAAGLWLTAPIIAGAVIAVKLSSPGPALFRQQRVGKGGKAFTLIKLRTMRTAAGAAVTAKGDSRITAVGRVLRNSKLDELPELYNVLRGDMSFVGPRPEVPRFVRMQDPAWQRALSARPGLTDPVTLRLRNEEELLAQVEREGADREQFYEAELLSWKLRGYAEYLAQQTPLSDVRVLAKTALLVMLPRLAALPTLEEIRRDGGKSWSDVRAR